MVIGVSFTVEQRLKQVPIRAPLAHGSFLLRGRFSDNLSGRQALDQRFPYAKSARLEIVRLSIDWTQQYLPQVSDFVSASNPSLAMSGHQPELFHPGVWFKNFVLSKSSQRAGQTGINLIVDNDQQNSNWLAFPAIEDGQTVRRQKNFAHGGIGQPYEERAVVDESYFDSLPERLRGHVADFAPATMLKSFWEQAKRVPMQNIGYRFAAARHLIEWENGARNLEIPLSRFCQTESFSLFVFEILNDAARFLRTYNQVLVDYRSVNGLRGNDRPVPDLETVDQWLELPFWLWSEAHPYRQRLFTRMVKGQIQIAGADFVFGARHEQPIEIKTASDLRQLEGGWKLRTRALTTTMYCRSILSDVFLHGIGGAIYDQITDEIFRRYYGLELSPLIVATATYRLRGPHVDVHAEDLRIAKEQLRAMQWKPEKFVRHQNAGAYIDRKMELLSELPHVESKFQWQQSLSKVNNQLRASLGDAIARQEQKVRQVQRDLQSHTVENSREWSFLLFGDQLPAQLNQLADQALQEQFSDSTL